MPTYSYKAVTSSGLVVRNRVEAGSKQNLLRTLKENDLMPITIEQVAYSAKKKKTKKKNNIKTYNGVNFLVIAFFKLIIKQIIIDKK